MHEKSSVADESIYFAMESRIQLVRGHLEQDSHVRKLNIEDHGYYKLVYLRFESGLSELEIAPYFQGRKAFTWILLKTRCNNADSFRR
jgi:hypothetical protein